MDLALIKRLINDEDPIRLLYDELMGSIWTAERFEQAQQRNDLHGYLREGEHAASRLEKEVYDVYHDVYHLLERDDPRRDRIREVHEREEYTLLVVDGMSLREAPLVEAVLRDTGLDPQTDFALSALPSETTDFCRYHYNASGPSDIAAQAHRHAFAFRRVTREKWTPDFAPGKRKRFTWFIYPDDNFRLQDAEYGRHVVEPVERIVRVVASDPNLVRPLVITSDHGYLWQGNQCPWAIEDSEERSVLAEHFRHGRSTTEAADALEETGKAWVQGSVAAARGRFAWGGMVRGPGSLFKHGGASLLECLVPWIWVEEGM